MGRVIEEEPAMSQTEVAPKESVEPQKRIARCVEIVLAAV